ncbi:hypothetical protein B0H21DRAFT_755242 [Amylocystis lapponica]|nr:hypothetical protein B0H21DRAFT_755242 [Amylocystis lapponica]
MNIISPSAPQSLHNTQHSPLDEQDITSSRPLGISERFLVALRNGVGAADTLPLIVLDCSPATPILDADVIVAWAVLRLRHPMLASRIAFTTSGAEIVCSSALTQPRAVALAEACIEFALFDDRDRAVEALRASFGGQSPQCTIDIRAEMRVMWQRDVTGERGQYVFGMKTVHHQMDARRSIEVMRQFVALLAAPGRAQAELDAHFANPAGVVPPPKIPLPMENSFPHPSMFDAEERRKGREAFDEAFQKADALPCGLAYDGPAIPSGVYPRSICHTFSESDTALILRACKVQGVTVTQLYQASWAVATIEIGHEETKDGVCKRPGLSLHNGSYHCNTLLVVDLAPFIKALPRNIDIASERDISLQAASYPSTIGIPRGAFTQLDRSVVVWDAARRAKANHAALLQSPYFWHLIIHLQEPMQEFSDMAFSDSQEEPVVVLQPHPLVPAVSSIGDVSTMLPSSISASSGADCARDGLSDDKTICIADMMLCVRAPPTDGVSHLWTFDGRMTLQLSYDGASFSPARGDKFFGRVVDIFARVAV